MDWCAKTSIKSNCPASAAGNPKTFLQLSLNYPSFGTVKKSASAGVAREGKCAQPDVCPLSRIKEGTLACIKSLQASDEVRDRLRELGFCEEQTIRLLSRDGNLICQVCNARLGISEQLADSIYVQPMPGRLKAA